MRQIESEILSHLGSSDLSYANDLLEILIKNDAIEDSDFIDWLVDQIDDHGFNLTHLITGEEDIVALVYEFAIKKLGNETPITEYIQDRAIDYLYGNCICTSIDYDLSEDKTFEKLVKKYSKGKTLEQRLVNHFEKENVNLNLAQWVLEQMDINISEEVQIANQYMVK